MGERSTIDRSGSPTRGAAISMGTEAVGAEEDRSRRGASDGNCILVQMRSLLADLGVDPAYGYAGSWGFGYRSGGDEPTGSIGLRLSDGGMLWDEALRTLAGVHVTDHRTSHPTLTAALLVDVLERGEYAILGVDSWDYPWDPRLPDVPPEALRASRGLQRHRTDGDMHG